MRPDALPGTLCLWSDGAAEFIVANHSTAGKTFTLLLLLPNDMIEVIGTLEGGAAPDFVSP